MQPFNPPTLSLLLVLVFSFPSALAQLPFCCYASDGRVESGSRSPFFDGCNGKPNNLADICENNCCISNANTLLSSYSDRGEAGRSRCEENIGVAFGTCGSEEPFLPEPPTVNFDCCTDIGTGEVFAGNPPRDIAESPCLHGRFFNTFGPFTYNVCPVDENNYCCLASNGLTIYQTNYPGAASHCTSPTYGGASFEICEEEEEEEEPHNGITTGDPHLKTFNGTWFDYHGECDLVLVSVPEFANGKGLDLHVRTTIRYDYSFVESAALRIGEDVLEMGSWGQYFLNGVDTAAMPATLGGYPVSYKMENKKKHTIVVHIDDQKHNYITLGSFKDFVNVDMHVSLKRMKIGGLLGDYSNGKMLARDGFTVMDDSNGFGQEWQVLADEPKLFVSARAPQAPKEQCRLPDPRAMATTGRRLGESLAKEAAQKACSRAKNKEACIYDTLKTGDLEMARSGFY